MRRLSLAAIITFLILLPSCSLGTGAQTQNRTSRGGHRQRLEPNLYAPDLYADNLKVKFMLVDLPGAAKQGSYWEVSYKLFFISEAEFQRVIRQLQRGGNLRDDPDPAQFPLKILLASGNFSSKRLGAVQDRTRIYNAIPFKSKIPDKDRTKAAPLLTRFSVKIYDAQLKKTIYDSGVLISFPFDEDSAQPDRAVPRATVYANFYVTPQGELDYSQWAQADNDTSWRR